jgi:hypothetical protein
MHRPPCATWVTDGGTNGRAKFSPSASKSPGAASSCFWRLYFPCRLLVERVGCRLTKMLPHRIRNGWESREGPTGSRISASVLNDARKAVRYALEIDVLCTWSEKGVARELRARTRDLSRKGAFVVGEARPPIGVSLTVSFSMPALGAESKPVQMQSESRVARIEPRRGTDGGGFAVAHTRTIQCSK